MIPKQLAKKIDKAKAIRQRCASIDVREPRWVTVLLEKQKK